MPYRIEDSVKSPRALDSMAKPVRPNSPSAERNAIEIAVAVDNARRVDNGLAPLTRPLRETGGWTPMAVPMASLAAGGVYIIDRPFYSLVIPTQGNPVGARFNFDFGGGGSKDDVQPGAMFEGHSTYAAITAHSSNAITTGVVVVMLQERPTARYSELPTGGGAGLTGTTQCTATTPGGMAQSLGSAAGNVPTSAASGLSLQGVKGFRALLALDAGTITSGTVRLWFYDATLAAWVPTDTGYLLGNAVTGLAANRRWAGPDETVTVPYGRVYAEGVSIVGAGAASMAVYLQTWG